MDLETQKYFDNYSELFASQGWKQLLEDSAEPLDGGALRARVKACADARELGVLQGELAKVEALYSLQAGIEAAYDNMRAEEDE